MKQHMISFGNKYWLTDGLLKRRRSIFPPFLACDASLFVSTYLIPRSLVRKPVLVSLRLSELAKTPSRLQHLAICICLDFNFSSLSKIYFNPLVDLAKMSTSFDHIDTYVYGTNHDLIRPDVLLALSRFEGIEEMVEQGVWVLHVQEVAPADPRFILCPPNTKFHFSREP